MVLERKTVGEGRCDNVAGNSAFRGTKLVDRLHVLACCSVSDAFAA